MPPSSVAMPQGCFCTLSLCSQSLEKVEELGGGGVVERGAGGGEGCGWWRGVQGVGFDVCMFL